MKTIIIQFLGVGSIQIPIEKAIFSSRTGTYAFLVLCILMLLAAWRVLEWM